MATPDYSGLQMAILDGYSGLLRMAPPDYSGWLRRPQGFSVHTLAPNPVRDLYYNPYIHWSTLQILSKTPINVIFNNIFSIAAIHYLTTIYTYLLVHPLARAPETRLTHYLVAHPGVTVDGAKYITRSPRRLNIRQRWPRHYNIRSRHTVALKPKHRMGTIVTHLSMLLLSVTHIQGQKHFHFLHYAMLYLAIAFLHNII